MKIVYSKEGLHPYEDPVSAFIAVWCVSALYWINAGEKSNKPLARDLLELMSRSLPNADMFCAHYSIPQTSFNAYFDALELGSTPENLQERLEATIAVVRPKLKAVASDKNVTFDEVALIKSLFSWHTSKNPTQLANIRKLVSRVKMPELLRNAFVKDAGSQTEYVEKLQQIVKQLTGKPGTFISMVDAPKYRDEKPDLWKAYLSAARNVNAVYKQELHNITAKTGTLPIGEIRKQLEAKKIVHNLPAKELDKHLIDGEGRIYTEHGDRITGVPAAEAKIRVNPDYDKNKDNESGKNNNWVFQTVLPTKNAKGVNNTQYYYTENKKGVNKAHKFDVVQQMLKIEKKIVSGWRKDLKSKNMAVAIPAAQCEITYLTACRIGGKDNENKKGKTFGLTTWTVGNVKRRGESILFDYVGKDSVHQIHKIDPKSPEEQRVIAVVKKLCEGKPRAAELWAFDGTTYTAEKLRSYFSHICPVEGATPHKIRHLRGTRLAVQMLEPLKEKLLKQKKPVTQSLVDKEFKDAMTKVGSLLGHVRGVESEAKATWSTAVKSYIDPGTMIEFYESFEDAGVRVPKFLLTA